MNKTEREALRLQVDDLEAWSRKAGDAWGWHKRAREQGDGYEGLISARAVPVSRGGTDAWQVIPLVRSDTKAVQGLIARANLPELTKDDRQLLTILTREVRQACRDVKPLFRLSRFFAGPSARARAAEAAQVVREQHAKMLEGGVPGRLKKLLGPTGVLDPRDDSLNRLLDPALGFGPTSSSMDEDRPAELVPRARLNGLAESLRVIDEVVEGEAGYRTAAKKAADAVRDAETDSTLAEMPVDGLQSTTKARIPWASLQSKGITSIRDVLDGGAQLQARLGITHQAATAMRGAADSVRRHVYEEMPVRIDIEARRPEATTLLTKLAEWDAGRQTRGAAEDLQRAEELKPLSAVVTRDVVGLLIVPTRFLPSADLTEGIETVQRRAQMLKGPAKKGVKRPTDPWEDFQARAADFFAMLSELGYSTENEDDLLGDLPKEIIKAVHDQPLSGEHLNASLRGYQSFAARFALVQKKIIIGDEMGLGKTLESIAVLAHLRSRGITHFAVICPAAVVTNWTREVSAKSRLSAHRIHGTDRERALQHWRQQGGVAVTTYETLSWWGEELAAMAELGCVVVDEAHYIKNPDAQRSMRTADVVKACDRAILLTGTPLENKQDELRTLVSYVRPDIAEKATSPVPGQFRRQIAPAYLRRNQEQVLSELPGLIEIEDWLPMSSADTSAYEKAVLDGNFMAMRQAAMLSGKKSAKLARLIEIVREAEENQRRVIVFSNFRNVLEQVSKALPGQVFGPLNGSVPPAGRQQMVDDFSQASHGAVLVSQIQAGGVGLNIQAASVIVLCEPQLKPTIEDQAIARAHRMGQVQSVQVHRLLSEEGVDQRVMQILAGKRQIFDDFARESSMAASTPAAVDTTDSEVVRRLVAEERERIAQRRSAP